MNEIPPLWNSLKKILSSEKRLKFLPKDVAAIIIRLIQIRTNMFRNSIVRKNEDYLYYDWDQEGEVATQYYPNWRIIRWPRTYSVPKSRTSCNKKFKNSKGFSFGLFTVGCGCARNITLGKLNVNHPVPASTVKFLLAAQTNSNRNCMILFLTAFSKHLAISL